MIHLVVVFQAGVRACPLLLEQEVPFQAHVVELLLRPLPRLPQEIRVDVVVLNPLRLVAEVRRHRVAVVPDPFREDSPVQTDIGSKIISTNAAKPVFHTFPWS